MRHLTKGTFEMDNRLIKLYELLLSYYGEQEWWPANSPYEVMVGAILTQNTAWGNVEMAIARFEGNLNPEFIRDLEMEALKEIIRPSGFFNQKAVYLKSLTSWYSQYNYDASILRREPMEKIRNELLGVKGIGPETADSILLYAFNFPSFVVDTYTMRLCERYSVCAGKNYNAVKQYFEQIFEPDAALYNNFHALIVTHAKTHCRKTPVCAGCPLEETCVRVGVERVSLT